MSLTIGSLFSGIGGLELGLEWAGLGPVVWQVELSEYSRAVLAKHWPNTERYEDVQKVHAREWCPDAETKRFGCDNCITTVDVVCGGFPCQDVSDAGRRVGIGGSRSGLWSEFARIIRELRPRYVVVENVAGLLARGMGVVLGDLAALGYDAEWSMLSACTVGAPHARERVFILAYPASERARQLRRERGAAFSHPQRNLHWALAEPPVERMAHGVPDRAHRLVALGNAVVPQVAEVVGRVILELEASQSAVSASVSPASETQRVVSPGPLTTEPR